MTEEDSNTGDVALRSALSHNPVSHVPSGAEVSINMSLSLSLVYGLLEGKTACLPL